MFRSSAVEVQASELRPVSRLSNISIANQSFIHHSDFNQSINNPPDLNQSIDDPSGNNNNYYNVDDDKRDESGVTTSDMTTVCDTTNINSSVPLKLTSVSDTVTTRRAEEQTGFLIYLE